MSQLAVDGHENIDKNGDLIKQFVNKHISTKQSKINVAPLFDSRAKRDDGGQSRITEEMHSSQVPDSTSNQLNASRNSP